jgi:hypothetical protein
MFAIIAKRKSYLCLWISGLTGVISIRDLYHLSVTITQVGLSKRNEMKKNMGSADRIIRVIIAVAIAVLYFTGIIEGTLGLVLIGLAVVFVLTSLVSVCPLYLPFGMSSLRKGSGDQK